MIKFRIWIAVSAIAILLTFGFQNCGAKFQSISNTWYSSSSTASSLFTTQPSSAVVEETKPYTLTAQFPKPGAMYQWQIRPEGSNLFSDLSGASTANYAITFMTIDKAGTYRAKVIWDGATYYSQEAVVGIKDFSTSCREADLSLRWPLAGTQGVNWTIANYMDLDTNAGAVKDWRNATGNNALTYDGHGGIDMAIGLLRDMDKGVNVYAAEDGKVVNVHDGEADRNVNNESTLTNNIVIKHMNGFTTSYLHLKKNSILVTLGSFVRKGDLIAKVGSSGYSTGPHLHWELTNCAGARIEPMLSAALPSKPNYQTPLTVMDVALKLGEFTSTADVISLSVGNITTAPHSQRVGIALVLSGGIFGDSFLFEMYRPDGLKAFSFGDMATHAFGFSTPYYYFTMDLPGTWQIYVKINGTTVRTIPFVIH